MGVAERGEPGDVGGVGVVPDGGEVVERGLDVDGLPQHNDVDHDAQCVELVLLSGLRAVVRRKGGAVDEITWQTRTARLLARHLAGRTGSWDYPSGY